MDFIVALPPTTSKHDCLLTITCKYTKRVLLLPGIETWDSVQWADVVIRQLLSHDWGIPMAIISDRDTRFMSSFWKHVFTILQVKFLTSTAYHPQTDGQSERTNQTVEIAMRYQLTSNLTLSNDLEWDKSLHFI